MPKIWKVSQKNIKLNNSRPDDPHTIMPQLVLRDDQQGVTITAYPYRFIYDIPAYSDNTCRLDLTFDNPISEAVLTKLPGDNRINGDKKPNQQFYLFLEMGEEKCKQQLQKTLSELEAYFAAGKENVTELQAGFKSLREFVRVAEKNEEQKSDVQAESKSEASTAQVKPSQAKHTNRFFRINVDGKLMDVCSQMTGDQLQQAYAKRFTHRYDNFWLHRGKQSNNDYIDRPQTLEANKVTENDELFTEYLPGGRW